MSPSTSRIAYWLVPLILSAVVLASSVANGDHRLSVSYYKKSCPSVQSIVRSVMVSRVAANQATAPAVLRLFFHDCFVNVRCPYFFTYLYFD
jgi:peroxidase